MEEKIGKAVWNFQTTQIFCDICVTAVEKNMRPGTHFNAQGWKYVLDNFQQLTKLTYDKTQLKNKWDQLKIDWKLWKELKGKEIGLGWNARFDTLDAPADWWSAKIKVNKKYGKFRKKGIHPDIESKNDIMFGNTITLGADCDTPVMLEEPCEPIDVEEDCNLPPERSSQSMNIGSSSQSGSKKMAGKRKARNSMATKLSEDISKLVACVENRSYLEAVVLDPPGCTIPEVMDELQTLLGDESDSDIFYFASLIFEQKTKRIMWKSMRSTQKKLGWLKFHYELYKKNGQV